MATNNRQSIIFGGKFIMMELKVTVEILGIPDAINNLAAAIRGQASTAPAITSTPAAPVETPTQAAAIPSAPAIAQTAPNVQASPAPVNSPSNVPAAAPVQAPAAAPVQPPVQEKKITAEDISRAGAALVDQGKMADVINLLKRYGVQAITQLKEDVYPAFANDLRALGATL